MPRWCETVISDGNLHKLFNIFTCENWIWKTILRTQTLESVVKELCQPLFCCLHDLKCIRAPANAGVWYPAQCWFRVVAEALASQLRLCWLGSGRAGWHQHSYFQGAENQLALKAAWWWVGAGCFRLMCWRTWFSKVSTGGGASGRQQFKLSPFVLVWFLWRFRTGHSYLVTDNSQTEHVWSSSDSASR